MASLVVMIIVLTRGGETPPDPGKDKPPPKVAGDAQPKADPKADKKEPPPKKPGGGILRAPERVEVMQAMKNLYLAYTAYDLDKNKAAPNQEELAPYFNNNARIKEMLETRWITFHYGVRKDQMPQGSSNTLLAYETEGDRVGIRVVLFGDGTINTLGDAEFKKKPKAGK